MTETALRTLIEKAFKAGYNCQWIRADRRYIFDPLMKPGDQEGAWGAFIDTLSPSEVDVLLASSLGDEKAEWQPIETAPKDGIAILGYAAGARTAVRWNGRYWGLLVVGAFAENNQWEPTHWMPLPSPPPITAGTD